MIRFTQLTLFSLACLSLTACPFPPRIYRMDVRQGNFITLEMINSLKIGMSKEKVQETLGTPALTRFFEQERWDYYYYLKPGNGKPIVEKRVSIFFKGNKIIQILKEKEV
jgi:outer membrane protein assembly factor BamE